MKKTLFITTLLGAAFSATAETTTVTVGNVEYENTAANVTAADDAASNYLFYSTGSRSDISVSENTYSWISALGSDKTIIFALPDDQSTGSGKRLVVGNATINAHIVAGAGSSATETNKELLQFNGNAVLKGDLSIANDILHIWNNTGTNHIEGSVNASGKTIKIVDQDTSNLIRLSGGGTIGTLWLAEKGGNVTLSATKSDGSTATAATEYTIDLLKCSSGTETAKLTVEAGVSLNLGSIDSTGVLDNRGTTTITGNVAHDITNTGMLKLSGDITLGRTLTVSGGTVDLSGVTSLDLSSESLANCTYLGTGNGYATGEYRLISYSGDSWTGASSYTGSGVLAGATFTYEAGQGLKAQLAGYTGTSGTYCIVSDTSISAESNILAETTTDIGLGNGATLTLDSAWENQKTINSTGGTLSLNSGVTLKRANLAATGATVLSGSGVFETSNGGATLANLLGNNVSLSSWTGTVKLVGGDKISGMKLSNLGGKIEFNGVSGWDTDNWKSTMSYNVTLTDNGETAAWTNGAFSTSSDDTGTFSGTWSGTGTFLASFTSPDSNARYLNYKYTGNIADWRGTFRKDGGANTTTKLTFAGNATAINATIDRVTGKGTLNVQADSTAARTFNAAITADKLTVGSFTDGATGTATITLRGAVDVSTIEINAGTLSFGSATTQSSSDRVGSTNTLTATSITVNSGGTFQFNHDDTTISATLNLNGGKLYLCDSTNTTGTTFSKINLQAASTLETEWKGSYKISELTGSGNLSVKKLNNSDNATLTISTLKDYTGTISTAGGHTADQWTLQLGGVSQASGNATINAPVTLIEGFRKTGAGSVTIDTLNLLANKAIEVSEGSLIHDDVTYTALSSDEAASISRSTDGKWGLFEAGNTLTVSNAKLTTAKAKAWGGNFSNVSIANTAEKVWLTGDNTTKELKDVDIHDKLYVGAGSYGNGHKVSATVSGNFSAAGLVVGANASISFASQDRTIGDLEILGGSVTLGTAESHESHTLTVNNLTIGGSNSTLNANLKLSDGSVVTLKEGASLTLGCTVQLAGNTAFVVSAPLTETGTALIMSGVDGVLTASGESVTKSWTQIGDTDRWYTTLALTSEADGSYTYTMGSGSQWLVYDNTSQSLLMMAPEPATTTLSLLALAGLCARRRRR
ncbi:MAG: beta strand repeat-containing protein [Akkermansia sp.]